MKIASLFIALVLASCGSNTPPPVALPQSGEFKMNGARYLLVEKGTLVATENKLEGTGSIVFESIVLDIDNNYALTFSLKDGGSITLSAVCDAKLQKGVNVSFSRVGNKLKFVWSAKGKTQDLSVDFKNVDASKPVAVRLDIHDHGHIIIDDIGKNLEYDIPKGPYEKAWGLSLVDATVTRAQIGKALHGI